ncbi:MAG: polysaccharide deacetylase family protein [candidate division Zixibacteria bacterium]|nr:polysaccharide deacetylase family protein [candidate division Zixibacteria bacterium]
MENIRTKIEYTERIVNPLNHRNVLIDRTGVTGYTVNMKKLTFGIVVFLSFTGMIFGQSDTVQKSKKAEPKYICITFDDLPVVRVHDHFDRMVITDELLGALAEFNVKAGGFVIGNNIHDHFDLLEQWLKAGHTLGSHTYSHPDLNDIPVKLYIQDIEKGHEIIEPLLATYKQKNRYFRYPLLHQGDTFTKKDAVEKYLEGNKLINVPVSVDNDEYIYNLQFEKLFETVDSTKMAQLGYEYIEHMIAELEEAEGLAEKVLGRPINHVLLLHANQLNAFFLNDLLQAISDNGYDFISLDKALSDPIYTMEEAYVGHKGLSIIERLVKSDPDLMPAREGK